MNALVSFVWPAARTPTALIEGQFVCVGCGSDVISCERESLLMNVTLCPVETDTWVGPTTPFEPMVIVAPLGPGLPPDGAVGDPPPASPLSDRTGRSIHPVRDLGSSRRR